ncbi:LLM class flavin-dependent oxidoreductase [Alphaproteobacteria bacterium]|jgi:luciferase family oxidoreductase group 1|nr:LLM class flavin-dependent oxidoreductase [Alphaproteobacteria bacterium]
MERYSLLDLSPIVAGQTATDALANTLALSQHAEKLGYYRYWLAEHHNMIGIASAATSVVIGRVASVTKTIRVGAGGVMLPNHSPLIVAEHYGTLGTLFPDRIDLGLGRAAGADAATTRALRRAMQNEDTFPQDVVELIEYFEPADENTSVRAVPGEGTKIPIYILGSSLYGAQLAAYLGLPYAFASHFAPAMLEQAAAIYRSTFKPSKRLSKPYFMMTVNVGAADTDEEAKFNWSSVLQAFAKMVTGERGKLPLPTENVSALFPPHVLRHAEQMLSCSAVGSCESISGQLKALIDLYKPDEVIVAANAHSHLARMRSFEMASTVLGGFCGDQRP